VVERGEEQEKAERHEGKSPKNILEGDKIFISLYCMSSNGGIEMTDLQYGIV
jgi:hypothetical protein